MGARSGARPAGSATSASSSSSSGSTSPNHTRLFLNAPATYVTYLSPCRQLSKHLRTSALSGAGNTMAIIATEVTARRRERLFVRFQKSGSAILTESYGSRVTASSTAPAGRWVGGRFRLAGSRAADGAGAEEGGADPDKGGALLDRDLEVGRHAHGQPGQPGPGGQLGGAPEGRPGRLGVADRGRHDHQALDLEPLHRAAGVQEPVQVGRPDPVGGLAVVHLDLDQGP